MPAKVLYNSCRSEKCIYSSSFATLMSTDPSQDQYYIISTQLGALNAVEFVLKQSPNLVSLLLIPQKVVIVKLSLMCRMDSVDLSLN